MKKFLELTSVLDDKRIIINSDEILIVEQGEYQDKEELRANPGQAFTRLGSNITFKNQAGGVRVKEAVINIAADLK